jgi:surface carbohydrate biosynthesis protein
MKLKGDYPTIVFPIETLTRELDSKLVIAMALAGQGCRTIVGHKEAMKSLASVSQHIVWQGKAIFSTGSNAHIADDLNARGSAIMFIHDEGGMHQVKTWPYHVLKTHRVEYLRKSSINRVCVWGQRQKEVLAEYAGELCDAIRVTGTPKFDLCSPSYGWVTKAKNEEKKSKYGPYILACTRFSTAAHSQGQEDTFRRKLNPVLWPASMTTGEIADLWFAKWQRDVHDFADFVILTKEIARNYPHHTLILRPHPSENLNFYKCAFASFQNVTVTREDSVIPWIRSAEVVVHSNCTTGIEAVLAGRPVLNLLPEAAGRDELDVEVAREAGMRAISVTDALNKLPLLLSGEGPQHSWSSHAQTILNNLKRDALPLLVAETKKVLEESRIGASKILLPRGRDFRDRVRRTVKPWTKNTYAASKRGPLDLGEIELLIEGCRSKGIGKGHIAAFSKDFVVIDPQ